MATRDPFISSTYFSDNLDNNWGKTLQSVTWSLDMRAYVERLNTEVPHSTAAPTIAFDILESSVNNDPENIHKSKLVGVVATAASTVVDKYLNGAWDELKRFAANYTVTKTRQANSTLTASGLLTVTQQLLEHNPANWLSDVITVSAWQTLNRQEWYDDLQKFVTITESVVAHGTAVPTSTTTNFYEQRQVDDQRDILTQIHLADAFDRTTVEAINYTFPAILVDFVYSNGFLPVPARSIFIANPQIRAAYSAIVYAKVHEELISAADQATLANLAIPASGLGTSTLRAELFFPKPVDIVYDGFLFQVHVSNVLVDEYSGGDAIVASTNSADTYYGYPITETLTIGASTPSAADYIAAIGDEKCIEDSVKPWRFGLFWRRRVNIFLE